jgi:DNA modification methylase
MKILNQSTETVSIDSVIEHPRNPNDGDVGEISGSIDENGFWGALICQKSSRHILVGNHRWKAAKAQGAREIPVIWIDVDDARALKILLADNRTARLGHDDDNKLAAILKELQDTVGLKGTGYDEDDLDDLLRELNPPTNGGGNDPPITTPADKLLEKWQVKVGDLWSIPSLKTAGKRHRIICGDCTDPLVVAHLMGNDKAALFATDPPYGVSLDLGNTHAASAAANGLNKNGDAPSNRNLGKVTNDDLTGDKLRAFLVATFQAWSPNLTDNAAWYIWHASSTVLEFIKALESVDILIHNQIIWIKPQFVFGRSDYHWQHEPCLYGWVRGNRPDFLGERNQGTTWHTTTADSALHDKDAAHLTQKPVELFTRPILNHTRPGAIVAEPFSGSGTQLVAAEQTGRICYATELMPKYVSVALERLERLGLKPERIEEGVAI